MRAIALKSFVGSLFLLWSGVSLSFVMTPSSPTIEVGETVTFSVVPETTDVYDFAQLVSISLNINYDSAVLLPLYASISQLGVDSGLPGSADLSNYDFYDDPDVLGVDYFEFNFPPHSGTSSGELVHFTFEALAVGSSLVSLDGIGDPNVQGSLICAPSLGDSCFTVEDPADFLITTDHAILASATVEVTQSQQPPTVPIPGLLYLLGMGLAALATSRALGKRA